MPLIPPLDEHELDPGLRERVQFFKGPLGVVPNSVRTMARRPRIAAAFTDMSDQLRVDLGALAKMRHSDDE